MTYDFWTMFAVVCELFKRDSESGRFDAFDLPVDELAQARNIYTSDNDYQASPGWEPIDIKGNAYDLSTRVDWKLADPRETFYLFLSRFCVHALSSYAIPGARPRPKALPNPGAPSALALLAPAPSPAMDPPPIFPARPSSTSIPPFTTRPSSLGVSSLETAAPAPDSSLPAASAALISAARVVTAPLTAAFTPPLKFEFPPWTPTPEYFPSLNAFLGGLEPILSQSYIPECVTISDALLLDLAKWLPSPALIPFLDAKHKANFNAQLRLQIAVSDFLFDLSPDKADIGRLLQDAGSFKFWRKVYDSFKDRMDNGSVDALAHHLDSVEEYANLDREVQEDVRDLRQELVYTHRKLVRSYSTGTKLDIRPDAEIRVHTAHREGQS